MPIKDTKTFYSSQPDAIEKSDSYYITDLTEEDEMPENTAQFNLIIYFVSLLRWHYETKDWFTIGNLSIIAPGQNPIAPDVAVFKGVEPEEELTELSSWRIGEPNRPAPAVVFEIASERTWREDLNMKPARYGQMGVQEYFVYDPKRLQLWSGARLRGWLYNSEGQVQPVEADENGWLWSNELQAWLVDDRPYLRLYDSQKQLILTKAEAQQTALQELLAKLKERGIDPDKL